MYIHRLRLDPLISRTQVIMQFL